MAALSCLDHLCSVGPLKCRWTTWFTKYGGPTERKWSNRTQVVQAGRPRHDMRDAVPPCGTRRRGGAGAPEPPPLHPVRPPTTGPPIPPRPTPPGAPGDDPGGPSRPAPRPSSLDNPSYHTRGTHSEPLPEQPSQYRLPEMRPDARRITFQIVCCASSRLLRSLTLRCASFSRAVEGQGAQQREKGVADAGEPVGEQSDWCGWGS